MKVKESQLKVKDEKKHRFQIIAYQKAADAIYNLPHELKDVLRERTQEKIPGVGPSILSHLEELFAKGRVKHFEEIMKGIPPSVFPLLKVTTLGPKKAYKLTSHLKLNNPDTIVDDLIIAAQKNKIAGIPTFGEKSQADILRALEEYKLGKIKANRMPLPYAFELARKTEEYLRKSKFAEQVFPLGSLRRMMATVGDIDFAVATKQPKEIINHFINYPGTERVIEKGEASSSILVSGGRQVDLMVQDPDSFGSLLQHFTGSKYHNVALREFALKKGSLIKLTIEDTKKIILEDKEAKKIKRIIFFGYVIENKLILKSDIDIAVEFRNIIKKDATLFRARIAGRISKKIDVQVLNILPQKIKKEINEKGKIIYENEQS